MIGDWDWELGIEIGDLDLECVLGLRIWNYDGGLILKVAYGLKNTFQLEVNWIGCGNA